RPSLWTQDSPAGPAPFLGSTSSLPFCEHVPAAGLQPGPLGLEKEPSCLVLASRSCSSCLWPRRNRYSMCITSVFLMRAFSLNSSRIRGMKPGLTRTCCCSLLCRIDMTSAERLYTLTCQLGNIRDDLLNLLLIMLRLL
uniref:Uncharacterized protein n=1 Tax=Oryzias latipes TaxID=8090 RepID=A0A3P9HFT1_ORYLA